MALDFELRIVSEFSCEAAAFNSPDRQAEV
jgi:hypothetical protein